MQRNTMTQRPTDEELVAAWLAKGNKPIKIPEGQRGDPNEAKTQWGKPRKKTADKTVDKSK
jgi:hypothetical protein